MTWPNSWGPGFNERGKKRSIPVRAGFLGCGLLLLLGRMVSPVPFLFFSSFLLFFFLFFSVFYFFHNFFKFGPN
jgi:hypothetical protein